MSDHNRQHSADNMAAAMIGLIVLAAWWHLRSIRLWHVYIWLGLAMLIALVLTLGTMLVKKRRVKLYPSRWDKLSGQAFEDQIVIWLKLCGYREVVKTEYYDRGLDIIAARPGAIVGVQVKRSARPVGVAAVRAAVAGLKSYGCTQAMVITNASFTKPAIRLAAANNCRLVDGVELRASSTQLQFS